MDRIYIRDLRATSIIGTMPAERTEKQELVFNIELGCDLSSAGRSDSLEDTIDYKKVKRAVLKHVEASSFKLLEALAESVAGVCMDFKGVESVKVTVDKPGALRFARSVAVEIERS